MSAEGRPGPFRPEPVMAATLLVAIAAAVLMVGGAFRRASEARTRNEEGLEKLMDLRRALEDGRLDPVRAAKCLADRRPLGGTGYAVEVASGPYGPYLVVRRSSAQGAGS